MGVRCSLCVHPARVELAAELIADARDATMRPASDVSAVELPSLDEVIEQMELRKHGGRLLADGTIEREQPCPQCGFQSEVSSWLTAARRRMSPDPNADGEG